MKIYTVHSNPALAHDPERDPVLVQEGFAWWALVLPLPWALVHRLWLVSLAYVILALVLNVIVRKSGYGEAGLIWAQAALNFVFACEARDLQRWTLRRRGWEDAGIVAADRLEEAELRWFGGHAPNRAAGVWS